VDGELIAGPDRHTQRILDAFMPAAASFLRRYYRPDCCLAATALCVDVLGGRLHLPARPAAVRLEVLNRAMVAYLQSRPAGADADAGPGEVEAVVAAGGWSVVLGDPGHEAEPDKWAGHVTCLVGDRLLVDLAAPQASRPARGIVLPPLAVPLPPGFSSGAAGVTWDTPDGGLVRVRALPGHGGWERGPDWSDRARRTRAAAAVWPAVRAALRRR
jgi:hypothetical protein